MSVLLPNIELTARVRAHPAARDARGFPVMGTTTTDRGPYPCAVTQPDGGDSTTQPWRVRCDPRMWELRTGDTLLEVGGAGRTWVIQEAVFAFVPGYSDVDFIRVLATLDPPRTP